MEKIDFALTCAICFGKALDSKFEVILFPNLSCAHHAASQVLSLTMSERDWTTGLQVHW